MKLAKIIFIIALFSHAIIAHAGKPPEIGIREPDKKIGSVEYYSFWLGHLIDSKTGRDADQRPKATKYFSFESEGMTYSLKFSEPSNYITNDTYYVKTFGGEFPTVRIEVIAGRFIAFPETIKGSEIYKDARMENPMKAITHVYDIRTGKIISKSEPYTYDHDVPLVYDLLALTRLAQTK